jgi:hypothetical protein
MKKLTLLFILCMVSMLAFAQSQSPNYLGDGVSADDAPPTGSQELASDDNLPPCSGDDLTLTPQHYNFGEAPDDFPSYGGFTLCNGRSNSVTISSITTSPNPPFSVFGTTCHLTLGAGDSCTITVEFDPGSPDNFNGTLTVECSAPSCPKTSTLAGSGEADVTLTPTSCSFGNVQVGNESGPCVITLKNQEPVRLTIDSITVEPPFSIVSKTCGSTVSANSSCTITVVFTPDADGYVGGLLTVRDNSPDGTPSPVMLGGTGTGGCGGDCCLPPCCPSQGNPSGDICTPPSTGAALPGGAVTPFAVEPLSAYLHPAPEAILNN